MFASALLAVVMSAEDSLPVRSITAFKDGHALVVREGERAVDNGTVRLDGLPEPLLGSFWPYATGEGARLVSATAGRWTTDEKRDVQSLTELIAANVGVQLSATVLVGDESTEFVQGNVEEVLFGTHVRLNAGDGTAVVVPITDLRAVKMTGSELTTQTDGQTPHVGLSMRLEGKVGDTAGVGLLYVQHGFRWIPQYRMTISEDGTAEVILRATLVNDLIDLADADVNLVVGVPTFAFKGQTDPIALSVNVEEMLDFASKTSRRERAPAALMSNAIQMQARMESDVAAAPPAAEVTGGAKSEDLYVYSLSHVTLKRGERMSIEVARQTVEVDHRYAVNLPVLPPADVGGNVRSNAQYTQAARQLSSPTVEHTLRVKNLGDTPLTTAPVLIFESGPDGGSPQLLAQSLQTYTPPGGTTSVDLGVAVDVAVTFDEEQTGRKVDDLRRGRESYDRVLLAGTVKAVNRRGDSVRVRVRRYVPGTIDAASGEGDRKILAPYSAEARDNGTGGWWYGYVPNWYLGLNPISRAEWTIELPAGQAAERTYEWHYFWQ